MSSNELKKITKDPINGLSMDGRTIHPALSMFCGFNNEQESPIYGLSHGFFSTELFFLADDLVEPSCASSWSVDYYTHI